MNIVAFLTVFMFIVVVHELGHFLFARMFNVTVREFAVGFGPELFRKRGRRTDFRINLIPLGGYVRLKGEEPGEEEDPDSLYGVSAWKRFLIVLAGPVFSIVAGYALFMLIIGTWGYRPIVIDRVVPDSPAAMAGIRSGDFVLKVNRRFVFDNVDMTNVIRRGKPVTLELMRDGERVEVTVQPKMTEAQYSVHLQDVRGTISGKLLSINGSSAERYFESWKKEHVTVVSEAGELRAVLSSVSFVPARYTIGIYYGQFSSIFAKDSGPFKRGDILTKVENRSVVGNTDLFDVLTALSLKSDELYVSITGSKVDSVIHPFPESVTVEYLSNGARRVVSVGRDELLKILSAPGVLEFQSPAVRPGGFEFFRLAIARSNRLALYIWRTLPAIFVGRNLQQVTGPVGIVQVINQAVKVGLETILTLVAIITINLGIFNLLPLPALDGGRIIFALLEMVTRRKFNRNIENLVHTIGFFLLLAFIFVVTIFDISRLMGR